MKDPGDVLGVGMEGEQQEGQGEEGIPLFLKYLADSLHGGSIDIEYV